MATSFLNIHDVKQVVKISTAPKRIAKIQFGTLRSDEIEKVSELQVTCRDVYQMIPQKVPATNVRLNKIILFEIMPISTGMH